MRKISTFLICAVVLAACSTQAPVSVSSEALQENATFGVARGGGVPTTKPLTVTKPFVPAGTVTTIATSGGFAPAPGQGLLPGEDPVALAVEGILYTFDMTFTPPPGIPQLAGAPAALNGMVVLEFTTAAGVSLNLQINLQATIEQANFELGAPSIDLGKVAVGEARSASIILNNPNVATPVEVQGVQLAADAEFSLDLSTTVFPFTIDPQSNARIPLVYAPTAEVINGGNFTVTHDAGDPVAAPVRGEGIAGEIVVIDGFFPLDANGETGLIDIDLPPQACSISVFCSVPFIEDINIIHFEGPSGTVYTRDDFLGPWLWYATFPNGLTGEISTQFPNSDFPEDQMEAEGGRYRLNCSDIFFPFGTMYIRVTAELRAGGVPTKGQLPLNVFLATGLGISVADAPNDAKLQGALESTDQILAQAGLRLGDVNYFVITDPFYDVITDFAHLESLFFDAVFFSASPFPADPYGPLNLFFVNDFAQGQLGEAGAVPGPRLDFDNIYNGVAVGYDSQSAAVMGVTTAHEIGHFLALLHTVEGNGVVFDIIKDTAQCPIGMTSPECPVIGNNNLLYPLDIGVQATILKPGQSHVILRHAHVQPGHPATFFSNAKVASNTPHFNAVLASNPIECATCRKLAMRGK